VVNRSLSYGRLVRWAFDLNHQPGHGKARRRQRGRRATAGETC